MQQVRRGAVLGDAMYKVMPDGGIVCTSADEAMKLVKLIIREREKDRKEMPALVTTGSGIVTIPEKEIGNPVPVGA